MSAKRSVLPALVAGVLVLSGCGGSSTTKTVTASATTTSSTTVSTTTQAATPSAAERAVAANANLRLTDFPTGWEGGDKQSPITKTGCVAINGAHAATSVHDDSPEFSTNEDATEAKSVVYLYGDEPTASHWFAQLTTQATRECIGGALAKAATKSGQAFKIGDVTTGSLSIAPVGDERAAARLTIPVSAEGQSVTVYADLVFVRVGRGIAILELFDTLTSFDSDLGAKLVSNVTNRLSAGLKRVG